MTVHSGKLLRELIDAAGDHYWQQDQGTGSRVGAAEERFNKAKRAMERHIARLEAAVITLSANREPQQ